MNTRMSRSILASGFFIIFLGVIAACSTTPETAMEETQEPVQEPTTVIKPTATEEPQKTEEIIIELPCTISLWHSFNQDEIESLLEISEAYKELYPDVEFDFMFNPNFDILNKFEDAAASGGGPSILIGSGEWGPAMFDNSYVQDISELADEELLTLVNDAALKAVTHKEALIGLPLNVKGVLPYRNVSIMPEAPETFSEMIEQAQSATLGENIGAYLGYGLYYSGGHLEAIGGSLMDTDGNPAFNDAKGIEWVEMLKRFKEAGPVELNNENSQNLFREGRVGILIDDLSVAPDLVDVLGTNNLMIDNWPTDMAGYIRSDVIFLNANLSGHDLDCGWNFMNYLLSNDAQELFSDPSKAGFIPAVKGVDLSDPVQRQAAAAFSDGTAMPVVPEMDAYWEPLNFALQSVVEFEVDPVEALSAAEVAILTRIAELHQE